MTIPDEKVPLLIEALEHLAAYRRVQQRNEQPYLELVEELRKKPPAKEESKTKARNRA